MPGGTKISPRCTRRDDKALASYNKSMAFVISKLLCLVKSGILEQRGIFALLLTAKQSLFVGKLTILGLSD